MDNTTLAVVGGLGAVALLAGRDRARREHERAHWDARSPIDGTAPVRVGPVGPIRYVGPTEPLPRTYDPIFAREGRGIPVSYLRALAAHESDLRPDVKGRAAWGLLQVVEAVRRDYNQRHGTSYDREALLDPTTNVRIAVDTLDFIIESYRAHHNAANLTEDWQNPRFVELLTAGWNCGYSEEAGVGRVALLLESTNQPVTLDTVIATAKEAGATRYLSEPLRAQYARAVAATYQRERERDARDGYAIGPSGAAIQVAHASVPTGAPPDATATHAAPSSAPSTDPAPASTIPPDEPAAPATAHDIEHLLAQIPMVAAAMDGGTAP